MAALANLVCLHAVCISETKNQVACNSNVQVSYGSSGSLPSHLGEEERGVGSDGSLSSVLLYWSTRGTTQPKPFKSGEQSQHNFRVGTWIGAKKGFLWDIYVKYGGGYTINRCKTFIIIRLNFGLCATSAKYPRGGILVSPLFSLLIVLL